MGMSVLLWRNGVAHEGMARVFGMPEKDAHSIFVWAEANRKDVSFFDITPEMVADDIDAYLARKALVSTA